jgi:hypothetical protein
VSQTTIDEPARTASLPTPPRRSAPTTTANSPSKSTVASSSGLFTSYVPASTSFIITRIAISTTLSSSISTPLRSAPFSWTTYPPLSQESSFPLRPETGLSSRATGGIAAAVTLVGIACLFGGVWLFCRSRNKRKSKRLQSGTEKKKLACFEGRDHVHELPGNSVALTEPKIDGPTPETGVVQPGRAPREKDVQAPT